MPDLGSRSRLSLLLTLFISHICLYQHKFIYLIYQCVSLYALLCLNPASLPLTFRSPHASAPVSFQRSAAGLGTPPCRQFSFCFPVPPNQLSSIRLLSLFQNLVDISHLLVYFSVFLFAWAYSSLRSLSLLFF